MILAKIAIRCKTFHGARTVYTLETDITATIESLKTQLIKADVDKELANCKQVRLIYPIVRCIPRHGRRAKSATCRALRR